MGLGCGFAARDGRPLIHSDADKDLPVSQASRRMTRGAAGGAILR